MRDSYSEHKNNHDIEKNSQEQTRYEKKKKKRTSDSSHVPAGNSVSSHFISTVCTL